MRMMNLFFLCLFPSSPLSRSLSPLQIIGCRSTSTSPPVRHKPRSHDIFSLCSFSQPSFEPEQLQLSPAELEPHIPTPLTQVLSSKIGSIPTRPKVVIFGATTSIGLQIVQTLMESKVDVDVVAFIKDYSDWISVNRGEGMFADVVQRRDIGPTLTVMEGDLICLHQESNSINDDNSTETILDMKEYNDEQLHQAISGSTALISCLQPSRPTNFYTDYFRVPFLRILNFNVSSWCRDEGHPYYVYMANKRILQEAELEQSRRMGVIEFERERRRLEDQLEKQRTKDDKEYDTRIALELRRKRQRLGKIDTYSTSQLFEDLITTNETMSLKSAGLKDRMKFIRISDLNVGRNPLRLGNILTNIFGSVMMRYEDMCEKLLKESELIDTIAMRIGDVVRVERNGNNTSLQISTNGVVPSPSVVGINDVSELAAVISLTNIRDSVYSQAIRQSEVSTNDDSYLSQPSKHFTWAIRWAGQHLQPPQGLRPDGYSSAALCFVKAMQAEMARSRRQQIEKKKKENMKLYQGRKQLIRFKKWLSTPWRVKPYAWTSLLSVYFIIVATCWMLIGQTLLDFAVQMKQIYITQVFSKILS